MGAAIEKCTECEVETSGTDETTGSGAWNFIAFFRNPPYSGTPNMGTIFVASLLGYIQLSPSYLRLAMYIDYIGDIDRPIIQEKHW